MLRDFTQTPPNMSTACLRHESIRNVEFLHMLAKASRGELESAQSQIDPASIPEAASDFIRTQIEEKAKQLQQQQLDKAVSVAIELIGLVEERVSILDQNIVDLETKLKELKKKKKNYSKASEYGKQTSNYLPLAALIIHPTIISEIDIDKSLFEIPKPPKATKTNP